MKTERPKGDTVTATVEWKQWVIARLRELGWSRADLARKLVYPGSRKTVSQPAIQQLLGPDGVPPVASRTRMIPMINAVLGGNPPTQRDGSFTELESENARYRGAIAALLRVIRRDRNQFMRPEDQDTVRACEAMLLASKKPSGDGFPDGGESDS